VTLQVVDKFIVELQVQLDNKGVSLEVTTKARNWLAEKGYDKNMGARPMARVIQQEIKKELAHELLFGELKDGGSVKISLKKDKLSFEIMSDNKAKPEALNS
jgi:ATP-dependent Clp protease ATP-binding subunit ClpA